MQVPKITVIVLLITFVSCEKDAGVAEQNISKHHLKTTDNNVVKKQQAVEIYDATALNDSASFVNPPTNKSYQWKAIPDNGCATFSGKYKNGVAFITFHCSGKYQIFANIYDSVMQNMIGSTDTATVEVTNETLYPSQPIKGDDVLKLRPSVVKTWYAPHNSKTDPPDEVYIQIVYSTTGVYEYGSVANHIEVTTSVTQGSYTFTFSDSVKLSSYPFSNGNGYFGTVQGGIELKGLLPGVPANLAIEWLGKTYTGKMTLTTNNQHSYQWNNSGSVKIY